MELKTRKDAPVEETWDLSLIYPTEEAMQADAKKLEALSLEMEKTYKDRLTDPETINRCLDDLREADRLSDWVGGYCSLAVEVDYTDEYNLARSGRIERLMSEVASRLSFIDSQLNQGDEAVLRAAMEQSPANRRYLADVLRGKPHYLHPETERALAALSQTMNAPYTLYNSAKLADMKFDSFTVDGETFPLGYSLFEDDYEYDRRTAVRRAAFEAFSKKIRQYENLTAAAYNAQVQKEKTMATLRGFPSVFDSLLFRQKVTREMYDRQINLITEKLAPHMRRYARLLKRVHKLDKMTFADLKIAVDPDYDPRVTIAESKKYIVDGLAILGEDYLAMVKEAYEKRWVDFAKNHGKCTGGFCADVYGKNSFILLSWNDRMADVFTLAHELGHAGHDRLMSRAQSILDTNVSTYFVEAPSTMNDLIMANYLLSTSDDKRFRRWVLSCMVSNTYYHNFVTHLMEAAYQREVYRIVDAGGSVQAETLSRIMRETLQKFWGDDVEIDENAALTWMRQPHYYMGLYSYTYSAGLTVATQMSKRVQAEGHKAVEDWKKVLSAGGTLDPVGLAALAGIDITTDRPLLDTIETIGGMIDEICRLTDELEA
ncbi:MAG: oligoendopeptidase F [Bacteroidales bacterium]|nr:oligoendopeptidase F [Bacteroidales bacterium]